MIKIGILEHNTYHYIYLYSLARLVKTENTEVTIFSIPYVKSFTNYLFKNYESDYRWVLKEERENLRNFLKRISGIIDDNIDLLFVCTVQGIHALINYYNFHPHCKRVLTAHNVNLWLRPIYAMNIKESIKNFLRSRIVKKYDAISVVSPEVKLYVDKEIRPIIPVIYIPFMIYDDYDQNCAENDCVRFVTAGGISEDRRDYIGILKCFESLFSKFGDRISLAILGKPTGAYGQQVIKYCNTLRDKGFNITVSEEYVPMDKFELEMRRSNVILGILNMSTYGIHKSTGAIHDSIRYAKPCIVPEKLLICDEPKSAVVRYSSIEELEKLIETNILNVDRLDQLKSIAIEHSKKYSVERLQNQIWGDILKILRG